jgi:hypothetical protein
MGNQKYKHKHRELGLCENCSRKAVPGERLCAVHSYNHNQSNKEWYYNNHKDRLEKNRNLKERYKKEGKCPGCGTPNDNGNICCDACNQRMHLVKGSKNFHGWNYEDNHN